MSASTRVYTQFQDLVNSFPLSEARVGILPAGRYRGYDYLSVPSISDTEFSIEIVHYNTGVKEVNNQNSYGTEMGVLVTGHGTVISDTGIVSLKIPLNTTESDKTYYLVCEYYRVDSEGGSEPEYLALESIPNPEVQVLLGTFNITAGGSDATAVSYVPELIPSLGNADIIDNNPKLFQYFPGLSTDNEFTGSNIFSGPTTMGALSSLSIVDADLTIVNESVIIPGTGNIYKVDTNEGNNRILQKIDIITSHGYNIPNGTIIYLRPKDYNYFIIRNKFVLNVSGVCTYDNIRIPSYDIQGYEFGTTIPLKNPGTFQFDYPIYLDNGYAIFMKTGNFWTFMGSTGAGDWGLVLSKINKTNINSLITTTNNLTSSVNNLLTSKANIVQPSWEEIPLSEDWEDGSYSINWGDGLVNFTGPLFGYLSTTGQAHIKGVIKNPVEIAANTHTKVNEDPLPDELIPPSSIIIPVVYGHDAGSPSLTFQLIITDSGDIFIDTRDIIEANSLLVLGEIIYTI